MNDDYMYYPDDLGCSFNPNWDIDGLTNPDDFEGDYWEAEDPEEIDEFPFYLDDDEVLANELGPNGAYIITDAELDEINRKRAEEKLQRQHNVADILKETGIVDNVKKIISDGFAHDEDRVNVMNTLADSGEIEWLDDVDKYIISPQEAMICLALKNLFAAVHLDDEIDEVVKSYSDIIDLFTENRDETTGEKFVPFDKYFK